MRYLPNTKQDRKQLKDAIGIAHINDIYASSISKEIIDKAYDLPNNQSELAVEKYIKQLANKNLSADSSIFFLGAGCYNHHIPASVDHIIQRAEYLTAYTPYQPEVSQGTLQVIFEFQSMISALTKMDIANASMYDGATAVAEAILMTKRILKKRQNFQISATLHPTYKQVIKSYVAHSDLNIAYDIDINSIDENTGAIIIQNPDFRGEVHNLASLRQKCDETGTFLIVVITEIISLGVLPPPSQADIVVGEAQSIGVPMSFGGPHLGFLACKKKYVRQIPGRLCGKTIDKNGKDCFTLTLNAREQHIRRETATSNICSNQGLCTTAFTIHLALLGQKGLMALAKQNHQIALDLYNNLSKINGITIKNKTFFNEFVIQVPTNAKDIVRKLAKENIIAGLPLNDQEILIAATEMNSENDIKTLIDQLVKLI